MVWTLPAANYHTFDELLLTFYITCTSNCVTTNSTYTAYLDLINTLNGVELINLTNFNFSWQIINFFSTLSLPLNINLLNFGYLYVVLISLIFVLPTNLINILMFESEKELNSVDDLVYFIILVAILFLFILNSYFCFLFVGYYYIYAYYIYLLAFVFFIFCIPTFLLLEHGFYYALYLRGSSASLSFIYEVLLDYINIVSFFLRIVVQFVRILILLLTLITYNELFVEYNNLFLTSTVTFSSNPLYFFLVNIISFLLEYIHVMIIFFAQCATFSAMLLWLFQFLFTTFALNRQEQFFAFK